MRRLQVQAARGLGKLALGSSAGLRIASFAKPYVYDPAVVHTANVILMGAVWVWTGFPEYGMINGCLEAVAKRLKTYIHQRREE